MSGIAPCCSSGERPAGYDEGYDMGRRNMVKAIAELYKKETKRQVILSKLLYCRTLRLTERVPTKRVAYIAVGITCFGEALKPRVSTISYHLTCRDGRNEGALCEFLSDRVDKTNPRVVMCPLR